MRTVEVICEYCDGAGSVPTDFPMPSVKCSHCNGSGIVELSEERLLEYIKDAREELEHFEGLLKGLK